MKIERFILLGFLTWNALGITVCAQTTLSGDHVVDGDLIVGTSANPSHLEVNGPGSGTAPVLAMYGGGGVSFNSGGPMSMGGQAFGEYAFSTGDGYSMGDGSSSLSYSFAAGYGSCAISDGSSDGDYSVAMAGGYSSGGYSAAMAGGSTEGDYSVAMADGFSIGSTSIAMAQGISKGTYSVAIGVGSVSKSFSSVVLGRYNVEQGSTTQWVESDPLFVIGNGTGSSADPVALRFRNAFLIRKNGDVEMTAKVKMPRQGDILMGEFGNPE